nr:LysR substrate-binding domain-containing protein [Photobacterium profundum]
MSLCMEACLQNRGIIFIPEDIGNYYLERDMLIRLFEHIEPSINYGWLVYPSRKNLTLAARTFVEFILAEVEKEPICGLIKTDVRGIVV